MADGTSETKSSNQMWGGRFASGPDAIMEEINASIGFDKKLYAQDIRGSKAHAEMLAHQGIISADDKEKSFTVSTRSCQRSKAAISNSRVSSKTSI